MKFFLVGLMLTTAAFASNNDLTHRPRSFTSAAGKAVFVDFTQATYNISYDIALKHASVIAEIEFNAPEAGNPIFDSVTAPVAITLDGATVTASEIKTPSGETTVRVISKSVTTGTHKLSIAVPLSTLVEFKDGGVKSAFWTSDLDDRQFLERYMPANFEFDQVKMTFNISFVGGTAEQAIYTNGVVSKRSGTSFSISYPSYYTASSIFFHTTLKSNVSEARFSLKSIDGRDIPAVVYFTKSILSGANLDRLKEKTTAVFHELESDYGAFKHPSITVLQAGSGGMEYCGATMTDFSALGHELFHSYFARGVMPANGNSGWLDEALASWRDGGYQTLGSLSGSSSMSAHAYYSRTTDTDAYSFGARFMGYLDGKMKDKGGLKTFMRQMVDKRAFQPLNVEEFSKEMSAFYGVSVDQDFKTFTYGTRKHVPSEKEVGGQKIHHKMTVAELQQYL